MSEFSQPYSFAQERYAELGVNTEGALHALETVSISLHCWQGDDVRGFECADAELGCGLAVTGSHPGRARTPDELRSDLEKALSLIPGKHRLNLHACYAELGGKNVDRSEYAFEHFRGWVEWCKAHGLGFDFNPTYFAHPLAVDGSTLSHKDGAVRDFWIEHGRACRRIAEKAGAELDDVVVTNFWVPDGSKDLPVDRSSPRVRLEHSLDSIFEDHTPHNLDAVESKLFGIGSESYVVGSHEFYLGYAITRQKLLCLDAGHFHPTESIADKFSSVLQFVPGLLLHVSRGVRWDSDHVVLLDDPTRAIMEEIVRGNYLKRAHIGLDYFDASINRVAAWVIGSRNTLKALLMALLDPIVALRVAEQQNDLTARLALMEEAKSMPFGIVWDEYCRRQNVPIGAAWLNEVQAYERAITSLRR